jgi:hypothetical protein
MTDVGGLIGIAQRASRLAAPVFAEAEWKWGCWNHEKVEPFVPDEEQIFTTVLRLLTEVKTDTTLSSGRFHVSKMYDAPHTVWRVNLDLTSLWKEDETP